MVFEVVVVVPTVEIYVVSYGMWWPAGELKYNIHSTYTQNANDDKIMSRILYSGGIPKQVNE